MVGPSIPLGGFDVAVGLRDEQVTQYCKVPGTDAFDIIIGTDVLRRGPQVRLLSLQCPYALHCDFASALFSSPLEVTGRKEPLSTLHEPVLSN